MPLFVYNPNYLEISKRTSIFGEITTSLHMNKNQKIKRNYVSPQLIAVEIKMGQSLLEIITSKEGYTDGGESTWGDPA